jgi:hypothetical protein
MTSSFQIQRAVVRRLRLPTGPRSYIFPTGDPEGRDGQHLSGKFTHEGFAPEKTAYPFVTYQQWPSTPIVYTWGSKMLLARFDVKTWSPNSVEANNLDALCAAVLDEAQLSVAGQSTLICRRVADLRSPDVDEEGIKVYSVGGTYEIWTDQPL